MPVTDEQFDRAFGEWQEFGPRRIIQVEQRWREGLSDINPDEFADVRARCEAIEESALHLAHQVWSKQMTDDAAMLQLARLYPFLTSERLAHTWSQAMYFSMK